MKEMPIITFNKYCKLREGGRVDFDKSYGAQCVDLIRDWVGYAKLPAITNYGNANVLANVGLGSGWTFVKNTPLAIPNVGDIIFWNYKPYGHVAVVGRAGLTWVEVLEQNAGSGNGDGVGKNSITLRRKNYKNIIGWYTPKK